MYMGGMVRQGLKLSMMALQSGSYSTSQGLAGITGLSHDDRLNCFDKFCVCGVTRDCV